MDERLRQPIANGDVGVYGGSFNPPHVGHVLLASHVIANLGLSALMVVPCFAHAFAKRLLDFDERLELCELAFGAIEGVEISPLERELPKPSFTLQTLQALAEARPNRRLRLVIGTDILEETHKWHRFDDVVELAPPVIIPRKGYPGFGRAMLPEISSTEIRIALTQGEAGVAQELLPRAVWTRLCAKRSPEDLAGLFGSPQPE